MSIVYGLETCDGTKGILSDAYGVYADPLISGFITSVEKSGNTAENDGHAVSKETSEVKKVK